MFVVITEQYYGGGENIKVFKTKNEATEYVNEHGGELDMTILEPKINNNSKTVYVVATEECYGVTENSIFCTNEEAVEYSSKLLQRNMELDNFVFEISIL